MNTSQAILGWVLVLLGLSGVAAAAPAPSVTPTKLHKREINHLVSHIPMPFRRGVPDEGLVKELETVAFAFDFKGGPIKLWLEVEETGQKTMEKVFTDGSGRDGWRFNAEEGHVCFAIRRGVSQRISKLATAAKVKHSTQSAGIFLMYKATRTKSDKPKDNGYTGMTSRVEPLWYGWKEARLTTRTPAPKLESGKEAALFVVEAVEGGVKAPRKVKLVLKAVLGPVKE